MTNKKKAYERVPYLIFYQDKSPFKETYGGPMDFGALKSHLLRPAEPKTNNVIVFMHPVGGGEYLPMITELAKAGYPVIYCQSRYPGNDTALIMEKVVIDLGNCIRHAKETFGFDKVILAGWSGGGSLSMFYQSQAENPTITKTPWIFTIPRIPTSHPILQRFWSVTAPRKLPVTAKLRHGLKRN